MTGHQEGICPAHIHSPGWALLWKSACMLGCMLMLASPPQAQGQLELVIGTDGEIALRSPRGGPTMGGFSLTIPTGTFHRTGSSDFPGALIQTNGSILAFVTSGQYLPAGATLKIGYAVTYTSLAGATVDFNDADANTVNGIIVGPPAPARLDLVIGPDGEISVRNPGTGPVRLGGFSLTIPTATFSYTTSSDFANAMRSFDGSNLSFLTLGQNIAAGASLKVGVAAGYISLAGATVEFKDPDAKPLMGSIAGPPTTARLELVIAADGEMAVRNPGPCLVRLGGFSLTIPNGTFRYTTSSDFPSALRAMNGSSFRLVTLGQDIAAAASLKVGVAVTYTSLASATVEFEDPDAKPLMGSVVVDLAPRPVITARVTGNQMTLTWQPVGGSLQQSSSLSIGDWRTVPSTGGSATVIIGTGNMFFRVIVR